MQLFLVLLFHIALYYFGIYFKITFIENIIIAGYLKIDTIY